MLHAPVHYRTGIGEHFGVFTMGALEQDFVTVGEAASLLRVSPATVRRWIREGDVPAYHLGPRRVALRRSDLTGLITPIRSGIAYDSGRSGDPQTALFPGEAKHPAVPTEIRRLTPEEVQRGRDVLKRARELREELTARRGGERFSSSWEIISEMRDDRIRQLTPE